MDLIFKWWFTVMVLGFAVYPITFITLKHLPDKGYFFSKVLSLLLMGYMSWLFGYLAFNDGTIFTAFALLLALSGLLLWTWIGKALFDFIKKKSFNLIVIEGLFFLAFLIAGVYKMRSHDIVGTEKPMDFAFINGILTSPTMPPHDPWLSGGSISYYYFGYLIVAMLCKITGVTSGEAFNLGVALTWALAGMGAFSLGYALTRKYRYSFLSMACLAIFGNLDYWHRAIQSFVVGDLAKPYYDHPVNPSLPNGLTGFFGFLFSPLQHGWDYFQASRIMTVSGTTDKMINEFPSFSFFLSDLHPHVMAIPFVLLALALAFNLLKATQPDLQVFGGRRSWQIFQWVLFGIVFGGLSFLNSWDFPTFTFLLGLCLFLQQWWASESDFVDWFKRVAAVGIPIVVVAFLLYAPFYLRFQSQAQGVGLVTGDRTDLYHLVVIFGFFFVILLPSIAGKALQAASEKKTPLKTKRSDTLICALCGEEGSGKKFCGFCGGELVPNPPADIMPIPDEPIRGFLMKLSVWLSRYGWIFFGASVFVLLITNIRPVQLGTFVLAGLFAFLSLLSLGAKWESREMVFATLLVFLGFFLILGCEVFYLKDLFSGALYRMNSIFKFHYQVWILFSIAAGPFLKWLLEVQWPQWAPWKKWTWGTGAAFAFLGAFLYPVLSLDALVGRTSADLATMDGAVYYEHTFPTDYQVAQWIKENIRPANGKVPVILEASGGSYHQDFDCLATLTGYPTVLGWDWHEVQWRGSGDKAVIRGQNENDTIQHRQADIDAIYTSPDLNQTRDLVKKYGIDYVYVGDSERNKYNNSVNLAKFSQMGMVATQIGNSVLYKIN
jgi:YYY domain-containing protein